MNIEGTNVENKIKELKKIKKKLEEESSYYPINEEWIQAKIEELKNNLNIEKQN